MAWVARGGRRYYYRSIRIGDRVTKRYFGCGVEAERAAAEDAARFSGMKQAAETVLEWGRQLRPGDELMDEFDRRLRMLTEAELLTAGFHRHRGTWRRRRERGNDA